MYLQSLGHVTVHMDEIVSCTDTWIVFGGKWEYGFLRSCSTSDDRTHLNVNINRVNRNVFAGPV